MCKFIIFVDSAAKGVPVAFYRVVGTEEAGKAAGALEKKAGQ